MSVRKLVTVPLTLLKSETLSRNTTTKGRG
jgi:hypothetical protein